MSEGVFKIWALLATAVALVLLGILIGRSTSSGPQDNQGAAYTSDSRIDTSRMDAADVPDDAYVIPDEFTMLPSEWRSSSDDSFEGYAILFDPPRREVIVEQCRHPGYFDEKRNKPVEEGQEFCTNTLWATLEELSELSAMATDRDGRLVELTLSLIRKGSTTQLALSFEDHDMLLIPGSKNDLYQAMDKMPVMDQQKRQLFAYQEAEYQKQLKARQQAGETDVSDIPRYTLPAKRDDSNNE